MELQELEVLHLVRALSIDAGTLVHQCSQEHSGNLLLSSEFIDHFVAALNS